MTHDERLYGIAPVERDAHHGTVYLTMFGVMQKLGMSEATMRRNPGLMALRKVLGANTFRWIESEVAAYVAQQSATPKPSKKQIRDHVYRVGLTGHDVQAGMVRGKKRDSALQALMDAKMAAYHKGGEHEADV
jgi:predicted DNA-binding transcriptional regulator AlpA